MALMTETMLTERQTVNVLGVTFKENCSDTRNSQVFTLIAELQDRGVEVHVADPLADEAVVSREYGIGLEPIDQLPLSNVLIIAVAHKAFGSG